MERNGKQESPGIDVVATRGGPEKRVGVYRQITQPTGLLLGTCKKV